jgi:hypothetical protein
MTTIETVAYLQQVSFVQRRSTLRSFGVPPASSALVSRLVLDGGGD